VKRFEFSLQRVLDYRRLVEGWARDQFLETQARRFEAEADREIIGARRQQVLKTEPSTVGELLDLERYLVRLEDEERTQDVLISILLNEEEQARESWTERRQEAEALEKLRERQHEEWRLDQDREEQKALDEWTITRRRAA